MLNTLRSSLARFISPAKNSMSLGREFLRNGGKRLDPGWSDVFLTDQDLYTGYSYAAIRNRSSSVARIASENIKTDSNKDSYEHPYLPLIWSAPTFSEFQFWSTISTYLDLEGVYYLMAVRAVNDQMVGKIQEFKLLNPYHVKRVLDSNNLSVVGYIESRNGMQREIPKEMIIEMRELNPFDDNNPYSMTDAAKGTQFTLKTSGDYTRKALSKSLNAPGVLATDVILQPEVFKNFVERVRNHTKGEPLFANGAGAIKWESMESDLSKAALKDVNEIGRDELFSIYNVSKTLMGIEQSGTTRDTARVQKDLSIENQVLPRIQLIIDALNLDYQKYYPKDEAKPYLMVENPNATDQDAEIKKNTLKKDMFELYDSMLSKGYNESAAAEYVTGAINIEDLGKPEPVEKIEEKPVVEDVQEDDAQQSLTKKKDEVAHVHTSECEEIFFNSLSDSERQFVDHQQQMLKNSVINVQENLVTEAISNISKFIENDIDQETDIISKSEKRDSEKELVAVLAAFYGTMYLIRGPQVASERSEEFDMPAMFSLDRTARSFIKGISNKVAESHITTVSNEIYQTARDAALAGDGQQQIVSKLRNMYVNEMSKARAKTIADTETNRAFTTAQYYADQQFIKQNKLKGKTYKKWVTQSSNPCEFCMALESEGEIPFEQSFRSIGGSVSAGGKSLKVNFSALDAGTAHPNCFCTYKLIIKKD